MGAALRKMTSAVPPFKNDSIPFYHGRITAGDCKRLLQRQGEFLLRDTNNNETVLSVLWNGNVANFVVRHTSAGKVYVERYTFESVVALVDWHRRHGIPLSEVSCVWLLHAALASSHQQKTAVSNPAVDNSNVRAQDEAKNECQLSEQQQMNSTSQTQVVDVTDIRSIPVTLASPFTPELAVVADMNTTAVAASSSSISIDASIKSDKPAVATRMQKFAAANNINTIATAIDSFKPDQQQPIAAVAVDSLKTPGTFGGPRTKRASLPPCRAASESFYHGLLSPEDCKPRLTTQGDYLLRHDLIGGKSLKLVLSVQWNYAVRDFIVNESPTGKYYVDDTHFASVSDMVSWHAWYKIPLARKQSDVLPLRPVRIDPL